MTKIKYPEYWYVRRTLVPLYRDKFENDQHAYAKARLVDLLRRLGYDQVEVEKQVPCTYFLSDRYRYDYAIDVFGVMNEEDPVNQQKPPIDSVAFEIGGLNTYHSSGGRKTNSGKPFGQVKEKRKKELICEQYPEVRVDRYFIVEKDDIFSREYMRTDEQLITDYKLRKREGF